jgi:hypothetical protein
LSEINKVSPRPPTLKLGSKSSGDNGTNLNIFVNLFHYVLKLAYWIKKCNYNWFLQSTCNRKFLKIYLNYDFFMGEAYSKHAFHKSFMNSMGKPNIVA